MYIPQIFEETDPHKLMSIISRYSFATLITNSTSGLEANHIPLFVNRSNDRDVLQGHLSKANPLWQSVPDRSEVLVVFQGPNAYISPNYYPSKKEHGKVVPTWNYVAVHVKGTITYIHDEQWNKAMINNLTNQHEQAQATPWSIADAPNEYIQKMLSAIVGIEIEMSSIVGKWKVSQNQSADNKSGVIAGLSCINHSDAQSMAELVKEQV